MSEFNRRESDKHLDIEQMIIEEPDPKQRAFLVVLNSINQSLQANTVLTQTVSSKLEKHLTNFEEHAREEEALMNKGRGAWKVAAWVIGIAQVIGVAVWVDARSELMGVHNNIATLTMTDANHDHRLKALEKK
jgi:hypothetical protein